MFYMLSYSWEQEYLKIQVDAELIDSDSEKEKIEYEIVNNKLFYSLCDMLSIDFRAVAKDIAQTLFHSLKSNLSSPPYNEIFKVLKKYSLLLCDSNIIKKLGLIIANENTGNNEMPALNSLELSAFRCFYEFIALKRYIILSTENRKLLEADIYHEFAHSFLGVEFAKCDDATYLFDPAFFESMEEERFDFTINSFAKNIKPLGSPNAYSSDKHIEAIAYMFKALLQDSYLVKKCENCGKYFVPYNRSDTIYCDRNSPQDSERTCKEYGTQRLWYDKMQKDEALRLYKNVYQAKKMMARRNPDVPNYKRIFEEFASQAAEWKSKYKSGAVTSDEFIEWLNSERQKKV